MAPGGGGASLKISGGDHQPIKPIVYVAAIVAAFGGLIFGYDIGGSGGTFTMDGFRDQMGWPPVPSNDESEPSWVTSEMGWITSIFALGAVAGSLPSGMLTDKVGRRVTIIIYAVIFSVAAVVMGVAMNVDTLYAGRFIGGIGVGGLSMASTCYQSEIAPERIRGLLVALQQLSITFGIFVAAAMNVGLKEWSEGWRISYAGNGVLSVALVGLMFFCPESPRWLYKVGRTQEARAVLQKTRQTSEVEPELAQIAEQEAAAQKAAHSSWVDLLRPANNMRYRTIVGVLVTSFQQLTGINAIMYFAPVIFSDFLSTTGALLANLGIMFVNFVSTFITIAYVDKYGRRTLLVWGAVGMTLMLVAVSILSSPIADYQNDGIIAGFIILCSALYVINFAFSWGPCGWIVPAELFPLDLRGKGMTLTTTANWLWNFVIGRITPDLLREDVFDLWGTFLFFAAWCAIMLVFALMYLPETKEVPLEGIDSVVSNFRRLPPHQRMTQVRMTPQVDKSASVASDNSGSLELAPSSQVA